MDVSGPTRTGDKDVLLAVPGGNWHSAEACVELPVQFPIFHSANGQDSPRKPGDRVHGDRGAELIKTMALAGPAPKPPSWGVSFTPVALIIDQDQSKVGFKGRG